MHTDAVDGFVLLVDEETDEKDNALVHILLASSTVVLLVGSIPLVDDEGKPVPVNEERLARAVIDGVEVYSVPRESIWLYITDNPNYMKTSANLPGASLKYLRHGCCWAHVMNLLLECFETLKQLM